jgi:ferredoxin--NADP+ reductase
MHTVKVQAVTHFDDRVFSFVTERPQSFRFKNGEFAMIGLPGPEGRDIWRAYSIVSTNYEDFLEFLSIKIEDGPFTSMLKNIQPGDEIMLKPKTTGSLVVDYLTPKTNLLLLATGTGVAPFMSIIRDHETYSRFNHVWLYHTVRRKSERAYHDLLDQCMAENPQFTYIDSVTREDYCRPERFWTYLAQLGPLVPGRDAALVCGSPALNTEARERLGAMGFAEGNTGEMGDFLVERAFVD